MIFDFFSRKTDAGQEADTAERLEALERQMKRLVVEWEEWYDKYRRLYARISKRAERADAEPEDTGNGAGRGTGTTAPPLSARRLRGF